MRSLTDYYDHPHPDESQLEFTPLKAPDSEAKAVIDAYNRDTGLPHRMKIDKHGFVRSAETGGLVSEANFELRSDEYGLERITKPRDNEQTSA